MKSLKTKEMSALPTYPFRTDVRTDENADPYEEKQCSKKYSLTDLEALFWCHLLVGPIDSIFLNLKAIIKSGNLFFILII